MNQESNHSEPLNEPWLIAAWPGLGGTALIAASHLIQILGAERTSPLPGEGFFELQHIDVEAGVLTTPRLPGGWFHEWRNPGEGRDLIIFTGEAQPQSGADKLSRQVLKHARARGARRVITFASLGKPMHPSEDPGVNAVATDREILAEAVGAGCEPLQDGQIGGLNGVLLGVADWEGVPGVCLMADIPYFAGGAPNPKAAKAALEVFSKMSGVDVDTTELAEQAEIIDRQLVSLLDRLQDAAREGQLPGVSEGELEKLQAREEFGEAEESEPEEKKPELSYAVRERIEQLFEEARRDKTKAFELKSELDRLGVFDQYEDRFLDLFKRAE